MSASILSNSGEPMMSKMGSIKSVHPYGSKILVEIIDAAELINTSLHLPETTVSDGGAPQAVIVELGPSIKEDVGFVAGQRIYWSGKGTMIDDPRSKRKRAILEISNILAIIQD